MKEKSVKPSHKNQSNNSNPISSVLNKPKIPSKLKLQNHFWLSIVVGLAITLVAFEWRSEKEYVIIDTGIPMEETEFPDIIQTKHKKKIALSDPILEPVNNPNTNEINIVIDTYTISFVEGLKSKKAFDPDSFDPDDLFTEETGDDVDIVGNPFNVAMISESSLPLFCVCAHLRTKLEQEQCNNQELNRFLQKNLRYPAYLKDRGKQGTVIVNYVVDVNGNIADISVLNAPELGFANEATRVVKTLPCMKPAKQYNRNVAVSYRIPIRFVLRN